MSREYNLIPFVPVIHITHIATAFSAKCVYPSDTREVHDFWEFNLEKIADRPKESQYVLSVIAPNTPHGGSGPRRKEDNRLTIISFKCISEVMQPLADQKICLSPAEVRDFKEIARIAESYITYENSSNNLKIGVNQIQLQVVKNRLEVFIIGLLRNHGYINEYVEPKNGSEYERLAKEIVQYFEAHVGESLSLDDISNHFFVSESLIKTAFRRRYNTGAIEYFTRMKIEVAKGMLSKEQVKEIFEICIRDYRGVIIE